MIPTSKITILLVDDKLSFGEAFSLQHDGDEFAVYHELYLSAAEEKLRSDFHKYDFVILDGLGHTIKGLAEDRGEDKHAYVGIKLINELSNTFGRKLPCCVYTAYLSDDSIKLLQEVNPDVRVFEKGADEMAMLQYIREEYAQSVEATFRMNHPEIARIFDRGWLSRENEREMLSLLTENDNNLDQLKLKAGRIRPIMEAVYNKLATVDRTLVPTRIRPNDEIALSNAIWTVAGKPTKDFQPLNPAMNRHLFEIISALQKSVSTSVMHGYSHPISRYTLASYTNTLADLLLWFSDFMQKRS